MFSVSECTNLVQKIIHRYLIMNVHMCLFKVPNILVSFQQYMNFHNNFGKIWNKKYFEDPSILRAVVRCGWKNERMDLRRAIRNRYSIYEKFKTFNGCVLTFI
jgi:hypothetical protein